MKERVMQTAGDKIRVVFVSVIIISIFACTNNDRETTGDNSKKDTMNTATLKKENSSTRVKGEAGYLYIDDGGTGKIPVLFLHSFGGSTQHWKSQLDHLRESRRAIAFDLRGHGQSEAPRNNDYDVAALVNDIATVADSLQLGKFILVGHSMGGSAAIEYAGKHPEKVAGLFITGTPGKTSPEQSKPIIASLESEKYDTVMENYMKQLLMNATPATDKLERDGMNKITKEASISIIKSVFKYDPLPALRNYPGPKLILSKQVEEQPNSLHKAFPDIPYRTVEGTSHWIQLDKPDDFNRILDDFLKSIESK